MPPQTIPHIQSPLRLFSDTSTVAAQRVTRKMLQARDPNIQVRGRPPQKKYSWMSNGCCRPLAPAPKTSPAGPLATVPTVAVAPVSAVAVTIAPAPVEPMGPPLKRQRIDSAYAGKTVTELASAVQTLDETTVRKVLYEITTTNLSTVHFVFDALEEQKRIEAVRIVDFDYHSKHVWHTLNKKYTHLGGAAQCEPAVVREAVGIVDECVIDIATETTTHSHFDTKRSALETLRKLGRITVLSRSQVGYEVRKDVGGRVGCFVMAVRDVFDCISDEEIAKMVAIDEGEIVKGYDELIGLSLGPCIFQDLSKVVERLMRHKPKIVEAESEESAEELESVEEDFDEDDDEDTDLDSSEDEEEAAKLMAVMATVAATAMRQRRLAVAATMM